METQENTNISSTPGRPSEEIRSSRSGRAWGGLIIVAVGAVLLAKQAGADLPAWLISWPMIPIAAGLYVGARHKFRHWGWLIPVTVGVVFMIDKFVAGIAISRFIWPAIIIIVGLVMIFRPRRNRERAWRRWHERQHERSERFEFSLEMEVGRSEENYLDNVNIFGGSKKVIISKDFRGGEVVNIFGGTEINLTQADVNGKAELEIVQVFGGTKLIVPANWTVATEDMVCIFGGLDDKRNPATLSGEGGKTLVLKGTCIFGGIDIRSF
jgi:predicted membrane protein